MPIQNCSSNQKPGFKWGNSGKCYVYTTNNPSSRTRARNKARKQGIAEIISGFEFEIVEGRVTSSNVKSYAYDSIKLELYITFNDNSTYRYDNITIQEFFEIRNGEASCITEGSNQYGSWYVGKTPSVGAAVYKYLVRANVPFQKVGAISLEFQFQGQKISFDYDETLSTEAGKELAKKKIAEGYDVYIITARMESGDNTSLFNIAKELGINKSNIYFTNHKDKWETIKRLGITIHYDNSQEQIDKINQNTEARGIKFVEVKLVSYNDYPQAATDNAKRALKWVEENGWGDCGTPVGKIRANQLANRENISRDTIARMASFERQRQNKNTPYGKGCGKLMWDAWGGDEGIEWAQRKLKEIDGN